MPKVRLDLSRTAACTGECGAWHTLPTVRQLDAWAHSVSTQVTISKKTIRKIAAAIAAVNNSREVGGLFMGYRHSSKYRIVDATCRTVKSAVVWRPLCWMVQRKQQRQRLWQGATRIHRKLSAYGTVIFGEMRCFRYKTKSRIGDLHKSWETVFRLLHCQKNRVTYGNSWFGKSTRRARQKSAEPPVKRRIYHDRGAMQQLRILAIQKMCCDSANPKWRNL